MNNMKYVKIGNLFINIQKPFIKLGLIFRKAEPGDGVRLDSINTVLYSLELTKSNSCLEICVNKKSNRILGWNYIPNYSDYLKSGKQDRKKPLGISYIMQNDGKIILENGDTISILIP